MLWNRFLLFHGCCVCNILSIIYILAFPLEQLVMSKAPFARFLSHAPKKNKDSFFALKMYWFYIFTKLNYFLFVYFPKIDENIIIFCFWSLSFFSFSSRLFFVLFIHQPHAAAMLLLLPHRHLCRHCRRGLEHGTD